MDDCLQTKLTSSPSDGVYCPAVWDSLLCWPATRAGEMLLLSCPPLKGIDVTKFASRQCTSQGKWEIPSEIEGDSEILVQGWTNYSDCYMPEIRDLLDKLDTGSENEAQMKMSIAYSTRIMELVGLTISLTSLIVSLSIFFSFRSLRNHRTRIHKNLFAAMGIQVITRLCLYVDQQAAWSETSANFGYPSASNGSAALSQSSIHHTAILCESFYVILEYARTTMFLWMFIEGLYLHNLLIVMVFQPDTFHTFYLFLGWGIPVILTAIWASYTATHQRTTCWWGYSLTPSYWILEGPRLAIILVNLIYLLNIIRVLVTKLRSSHCNEAEQLRKAVKAAIVLLPLLGITNAVVMVEAPIGRTAWEFAIWSFTSHFLTSFQGFFVSLIYCFLNGEVRTAISKKLEFYVLDGRFGNLFISTHPSSYQSTNIDADADERQHFRLQARRERVTLTATTSTPV